MQENCDDMLTGNRDLLECVVKIKELESNDLILLKMLTEHEEQRREWINNNRIERVDADYRNNTSKDEKLKVNYLITNDLKELKNNNCLECEEDGITNEIKKWDNTVNYYDYLKSIFRPKNLIIKLNINDHNLLKMHSATSKILKCNNSNNKITKKKFVMQPILKNGVQNNSRIFKCLHCTHETRYRRNLISHIKRHRNIKDFKCTYCSKGYTDNRQLSNHLLKIHNYRDLKTKLYNCDHCSYKTYFNRYLNKHMEGHKTKKKFKCSYCSKDYTLKINLNEHLLKMHKRRDIGKVLYKCDQCNYETYNKSYLKQHMDIHKNIKFKCLHCTYEARYKHNLIPHVKIHRRFKDFK